MKKIIILGSTGSIGMQTLDVIKAHPDEFEVVGLSAHNNVDLFKRQVEEFQPKYVVLAGKESEKELMELARAKDADLVVNAISGYAGLMPTYAACEAKKTLALANKESLVMAGELIMETARKAGAKILPIDSEPSAIWQALGGGDLPCAAEKNADREIEKITLTASGGPFWGRSREELQNVTQAQALNHPTWKMGKRISVDSATLMNKGFEIIETHWLFDVPAEKLDISIHRQSAVHSFVQFVDGNIVAILGATDMRVPISYALFYPKRIKNSLPRLAFSNLSLTFKTPDFSLFKGPELAYRALEEGGIMAAALCMADEIAVNKFLIGEIAFLEIYDFIGDTLRRVKNEKLSLNAIKNLRDIIK